LIGKYFEIHSGEYLVSLLLELVTAKPRRFPSIPAFQNRMTFIKERLQDSEFKMSNYCFTWILLRCIQVEDLSNMHRDGGVYCRCLTRMTAGNLTWEDAMDEMQAGAIPGENHGTCWLALRGVASTALGGPASIPSGDLPIKLGMLAELVTIRPKDFDSLSAFLTRIDSVKQTLQTSPFQMQHRAYTWILMRSIAQDYEDIYRDRIGQMRRGDLQWRTLMGLLEAQAAREKNSRTHHRRTLLGLVGPAPPART
jgi:hypothetical protein